MENYPIKFNNITYIDTDRTTRGMKVGEIKETGKTKMSQASFIGDSSWVWNKAPTFIVKNVNHLLLSRN